MNTTEQSATQGISILIVEDSPTQALKLMHVLSHHGYRVTTARNGTEALAALATQVPTLVITDINMPEMDGYELCQRIKDDPKLQGLPVILLTSLSDPRDILRGLECGADNFIVKPYDEEFLLSRVQYVLANLELRRAANGRPVTEFFFAGRKYQLHATGIHSIDLLLSTYETAVQKNLELSKAKEKLEEQACQLREKNTEMAADLEMARELQAAFIPRHYPVFPGRSSPEQSALQFCYRYTTTTELGGDFFDIRALSDTKAAVLVCDVMGHGVRAALVASILRGLMEELRPIADAPGRFLTEINRSLCTILKQTPTQMFATAFYLVVDLEQAELRSSSAGHPSALHVRRSDSSAEPIMADTEAGPALGIFDTAEFTESRRPVSAQDMVMIFTDGLYEVERTDGSIFDKDGLRTAVTGLSRLPTPELFDKLLASIRQTAATGNFDDDMCVVGVDVVQLLLNGS
ncbi:MAG: SpoIIE family protein phosphatase [Prosthecobacter sp.]|uniref:SpoIIE family protein phosphatase n=1 Tax=Prosthecobacter sp. TaxID=1965333 RepID=UPI0038FF8216